MFFFFLFAVQDFLDKAKKDFEEQWSKNAKVRKNKAKLIKIDKKALTQITSFYTIL